MRKIREAGETRRHRRRAARPLARLRANGASLLLLGALLLCNQLESMGARGDVAGPVPPWTKPRVTEGSERTRIDEQLRLPLPFFTREGERKGRLGRGEEGAAQQFGGCQ
jgi:hypothetical protein